MFHFTIRDVLWLTVVVGLAAAWLADHRELVVSREVVRAHAHELKKAAINSPSEWINWSILTESIP